MKYKFLREGLKSESKSLPWKRGQWKHIAGELSMCHTGLHCSRYPDQAFSYIQGEILAIVQTKGKSIIQDDKECWSDMKIVRAYRWEKRDSVALAIYAAELVIDIYEKEYPHDDRPRKAIEAAKAYLKHPTKKNQGEAARAAWAAADAAAHVADAAYVAANAAYAAYAADAADAADAAAAKQEIVKKIRAWMLRRIHTLKPYRQKRETGRK